MLRVPNPAIARHERPTIRLSSDGGRQLPQFGVLVDGAIDAGRCGAVRDVHCLLPQHEAFVVPDGVCGVVYPLVFADLASQVA